MKWQCTSCGKLDHEGDYWYKCIGCFDTILCQDCINYNSGSIIDDNHCVKCTDIKHILNFLMTECNYKDLTQVLNCPNFKQYS